MRQLVIRHIRLNWVKEHYEGFWAKVESGEWEPQTYREIDRLVGPDTIFIDFGANIGAITLFAAHKAAQVICFEPDPVSCAILQENIRANPDIADKITVIPKAVHHSGKPIQFGSQRSGGDSMSSSVLPDLRTVWTVETLTPEQINDLLPDADVPVFVKMDIEGGEYDVVAAGGTLWQRSNMTVLVSTHQAVLQQFMGNSKIRSMTRKLFAALRDYEVDRVGPGRQKRRPGLSLLHRVGLAAPLDGEEWLFTRRNSRNRTAQLRDELASAMVQLRAEKNANADVLAGIRMSVREAEAQTAAAMRATRVLEDRIKRLEIVTTEHPEVAARTGQKLPFASPAISVIMPTWDRATIVGAAIRSVQAQEFADWELLVIDDGSTDHTAEVIKSFSADTRIRYVTQPHAGQCTARNLALELSKGQIVTYLDSDNVWYPGYLAAVVATYAALPDVDCAYGVMVTESHGDRRLLFESFDRERLVQGNYIGMSTFSHRRSLVDRFGGFDEDLDSLEDWDLILRYTDHAPAYRLPFLAVRYRDVDDKRVSVVRRDGMDETADRIRKKWLPD